MFDKLFESVKGDLSEAAPSGSVNIKKDESGDYIVPYADKSEGDGYFTDSKEDAIATAKKWHPGKLVRIGGKPVKESSEEDHGKDQYVYAVWGNCKELKLRQSDLDSIPRHGPADEAIDVLVKEPHIAEQLDAYDADDIRKELKEYGAWDDEELQDDEQNRKRLLWVLIGNLQEEQVRKGDEGSEDEPEESEEG